MKAFRSRFAIFALLAAGSLFLIAAAEKPAAPKKASTLKKPSIPVINVPDPDIGEQTLAARKAAQEKTRKDFHVDTNFKFVDRQPESGITFEQHITDDSGRLYKAVHYDHGNGIVAADVDGDGLEDIYFISQLGGNELWKNLGDGKFKNITESAGVALQGPGRRHSDVRRHQQRRLPGPVRDDRTWRKRALPERRARAFQGHREGSGRRVCGPLLGSGVFRLRQRRPARPVSRQRRQVHDRREGGAAATTSGYADAFHGHMYPGTVPSTASSTRTSTATHFKDVIGGNRAPRRQLQRRRELLRINGDGYPDLYVLNMQGKNHFYMNHDGKTFEDKTKDYFPRTPWGAMGIKWFDFDNDGQMDLFLTDMHSDMAKLAVAGRGKAQAEIDVRRRHALAERTTNSSSATRSTTTSGDGKFEEISDKMGVENYWPWGTSVGGPERRRLAGHLHHVQHEFSLPLRHQFSSAEQPRREISRRGVPARRRAAPRRAHAQAVVRARLFRTGPGAARMCEGRTGKVMLMGTVGSRSSVIFDLDGDGDLDIVTNEFNYDPQVLISDLAQRRKIH